MERLIEIDCKKEGKKLLIERNSYVSCTEDCNLNCLYKVRK